MKYIVNAQEMKQYDENTVTAFHMPSIVLMERAALAVTEEIEKLPISGRKVLVVAGKGNNGGDGLAIGRLLMQRGCDVTCVMIGGTSGISEQTALQREILQKYGLETGCKLSDAEYDIIIDAMFGIGLTREISGEYATAIEYINASDAYVIAVDMPSGIHTDTGHIMGKAVRADMTVTFAFIKRGLILYPGAEYAGNVICREIGITTDSFLNKKPSCFTYEPSDLKRLPARAPYGNKGTFGKVLLIAGSKNMSGACLMAGESIYRTGAGLVRIMTVEENRSLIQEKLPEAVLVTYEASKYPEEALEENLAWADCIAIGPGLGQSDVAALIMEKVLQESKPLIIDADGINLIAEREAYKELLKMRQNVILTPHLGEFARLTKTSVSCITENIIKVAGTFARDYDVTLVCKDARTVVCSKDRAVYLNSSGNSGMATAGAGDVLTGIITGLVAQKMDLYDAAVLGVYMHGLTGDLAAEKYNEYYVTAGSLIEQLQYIMKKD